MCNFPFDAGRRNTELLDQYQSLSMIHKEKSRMTIAAQTGDTVRCLSLMGPQVGESAHDNVCIVVCVAG